MHKNWLIGLVLLGLAVAVPARADDWSKKYGVSGRPDFHFNVNDGKIDILSSDSKEIEAHVWTSGWRIPDDVKITESQSGDHVTIDVRVPNLHFNFGVNHRSLHVELRVPREIDLDVHTGDGSITSQALSGRIHLDSGDGNIEASGFKGDIKLHTGDGHIEGTQFEGTLFADTGDGRINVRGRFDALDIHTGDGNIEAAVENGSQISGSWSLKTGDGNIVLRVPETFHADLDAHTGDGHISLDFPVTVSGSLSNSSIRGKLAGGGPSLMLRTGDGSIRLERL